MKEKIKLILPVIFLTIAVIFPLIADARSGCCSHHGGVCGCGCCDGTSLSATCAPYYPQCNKTVKPTSEQAPPVSTLDVSKNNSQTTYNPNEYTAQVSNKTSNSTWGVVLGLGIGGFITYLFLKRKK